MHENTPISNQRHPIKPNQTESNQIKSNQTKSNGEDKFLVVHHFELCLELCLVTKDIQLRFKLPFHSQLRLPTIPDVADDALESTGEADHSQPFRATRLPSIRALALPKIAIVSCSELRLRGRYEPAGNLQPTRICFEFQVAAKLAVEPTGDPTCR